MQGIKDILEERKDDPEENNPPMTQFIDRGIELDKVNPDDLFGFPVSCRFKSCKGMMNDEAELKVHQNECHPRKDTCFASSC